MNEVLRTMTTYNATMSRYILILIAVLLCCCAGCVKVTVEDYRTTIREHPDAADRAFNRGFAASVLNRTPETITALEEAVALDSTDAEAWFHLGTAYVRAKRMQDAIPAFNRALVDDRSYPLSHTRLGLAYTTLGRLPEAIDEYRTAMTSEEPHTVMLYSRLGNLYARIDSLDSAIEAFETAIRIDPASASFYSAMSNLTSIYMALGDASSALEVIEQELTVVTDPKKLAEVHATAGMLYSRANHPKEALTQFREAVRLDPDLAEARYGLGIVATSTGDRATAAEQYAILAKTAPDLARQLLPYLNR